MPTIRKEILIDASPEQVWNAVSDVGAVHHRLVPGYTENTIMNGHERTLMMSNGNRVREIIVSIDEKERRMAYAVKESSMALLHHHASFKILPYDDNITKLVWTTDFLPVQLAPEIQARVDRGSQVMKETIEAEVRKGSESRE
ncbi:SRPBCC family protein [Paenibacillus chibensis]|uniref:SRPBCC family protein n=1 Tax=Paenibacillus chibensis TaxID=59846 RepID=UPI000FDB9B17|nr:SRPBCC family protein [Paenibacillus chibensis]MEC0372425.1 SRPBCC family protein [Paenibacillus chibensis]